MRIALAVFIAIGSAVLSPAKAQTYYVDLALVPTIPGTGGQYIAGYTGAGGDQLYLGYQSPIYDLSSFGIPTGSTIIFGDLDLHYLPYSDQYGDTALWVPSYIVGSQQAMLGITQGCNPSFGHSCSSPTLPPDLMVQLETSYTPDLQFSYTPGTFTPIELDSAVQAVPEISTWAMLLIGFAGIAFTTYRRQRAGRLSWRPLSFVIEIDCVSRPRRLYQVWPPLHHQAFVVSANIE